MIKENETKTEEGFGEGTLTEEELLMLDSLLYYSQFSRGDIKYKKVEDFIAAYQEGNFTSVMNGVLSDDASGLSQMVAYISQNDKLMNLQIVYSSSQTNLASSNAVCLKDSNNNLYVLYGGRYAIGDYDGDENDNTSASTWQDNFTGAVLSSTREQDEAVEFFHTVVGEYGENANHIIVSGHSKGGNLAQIVTILCGENITACLSIDGQGVSYEFKELKRPDIEAYGSKITSIMPSKSYVGALMYQIENANYIYIDSGIVLSDDMLFKVLPYGVMGITLGITLADILVSHFPATLLNENWEFRQEKEQSFISRFIHKLSIELTDYAGEDRYFSEEDKRIVSNALNNLGIVALELTNGETNWDRIRASLIDADTITYFVRSTFGIFPQNIEEFFTGVYYEMIDVMEGYIDAIVEGWKSMGDWMVDMWESLCGFVTVDVKNFIVEEFVNGHYVEDWIAGWEIIGDWFDNLWANLWDAAVGAVVRVDPLILDLGNDGFNIVSKKYGAHFDLNSDGFAERINWTSQDAILAVDLDGNGKIDNGREVFGDYHLLADGSRAANGFAALAQYDANGDGVIDANDEIFDRLRLWIDADSNGISEAGELKTLPEMGIKAINLNYDAANQSTGTEALIGNVATFEYEDGREGAIGEMWVASDLFDTVGTVITNVSEAVDGLPDVRSYGKLNSLHSEIMLDETGTLQALVEAFNGETDNDRRLAIVEEILNFMCDTDLVEEGSRGSNFSAKKLAIIESFMGEGFIGVNGENPNSAAAPILENVYQQIVEMYCFAMIGSKISKHLDHIMMHVDKNGNPIFNTAIFNMYIDMMLKTGQMSERELADISGYLGYFGTNVQDSYELFYQVRSYFEKHDNKYLKIIDDSVFGAIRGDDGKNYISGTTASDLIYGNGGNDTIAGGNGNDLLIGGEGDDTITGGNGNDILYGDSGNDILDGGAGDDILTDSEGDDTFIFARGYGHDTIIDEGGYNTIRFTGLNPNDILVNGTGEYDVTIRIKGTEDTLIIRNFRKDGKYADYDLEFSGIKMHVTDKNSPFKHILGSDEGDILKAVVDGTVMHAFGGDDTVIGSKGDDIIYGNEGNDTIYAGGGNDIVYGGAGRDELRGEDGADVLYGEAGDDILDGGAGNDLLFGGAGNDTYLFGVGYGTDIMEDGEGISTIRLTGGLTLTDIHVIPTGGEAVICINGTEDRLIISGYREHEESYVIQAGEESISVKDYLAGHMGETGSPVDETGTGTDTVAYISGTENSDAVFVEDKENIIGAGDGNDYIVGGNRTDCIFGGNGTDRILAGEGDDTVYGGSGNDQLFGEDGNDILSGGDGDDYINGGDGNDLMFGGRGTDFMDGGAGDDTYCFNAGDGQDIIADSEGMNTIIFGDGITAGSIRAYRSNWNDLLITFEGSEDTLTIKNYCINEKARNFSLIFADGTVTGATDDDSPLKTIYGTKDSEYEPFVYETGTAIRGQDGDDQLIGSEKDDLLYGEGGNDRILGNGGNDILYGGSGNDYLAGGAGDDTYIYKKGDGIDTISDNAGTNIINIEGYGRQDIRACRTNWNDLTMEFENADGTDRLVIEGFFISEANRNFFLTFNGGSKVHATAGNSPLRTVYGTEGDDYMMALDDYGVTLIGETGNDTVNGGNGNDTLYGGAGDDRIFGNGGNDTLYGGSGSDYLAGGAGNDTYIFNPGDGTDTVSDAEGTNTISFGEGFDVDKLTVYRSNWNDLLITFEGREDRLILEGYFTAEANRRFNVQFANGTRYDCNDPENPIHYEHTAECEHWTEAWSDGQAEAISALYEGNLDVCADGYLSDMNPLGQADILYEAAPAGETAESVTGTENMAAMTDLQVMKLAEELADFGEEGSVSDGTELDLTDGAGTGTDLLIAAIEIQ